MNESDIAIKIKDVGMVYRDGDKEVPALTGVSLDIEKGEFISLLGPSGCGKTTLLRIVADLIKPTSGQVLIRGESTQKARKQKKYGMVFQSPVLYDWRTVQKNVELPLELMKLDKQERAARAEKMLELVGLSDFSQHYPQQLSGGMQQRVGIARAFALRPEILLMDEPFSALDEFTREKLNEDLLHIWLRTNTATPSPTTTAVSNTGTTCTATTAATFNTGTACTGNTTVTSNTGTTCTGSKTLSNSLSGLFAKYRTVVEKYFGTASGCGAAQNDETTVPTDSGTTPAEVEESAAPTDAGTTPDVTSAPADTGTAPTADEEVTVPADDATESTLSFEEQVVALVNEQRAANGLAPLTLSQTLSNAARAKSQDMHDNNYFSHTSPTYGSPFEMLSTFGISYRTAGENIAMGYATPEAVMNGWMNSAGHRANILNANYTQIGVGYVADGNYWTQEFIG